MWNGAPRPPGPSVVVDIDGTLSDARARLHFIEGRPTDWDAFFDAAANDPLIEPIARLLDALDRDLLVVLLTGRPVRVRDDTLAWLDADDVRWDLLVMRAGGEHRPAPEAKLEAVRALEATGFELRLALDDDARNVAMFAAEGIPCVELHSG